MVTLQKLTPRPRRLRPLGTRADDRARALCLKLAQQGLCGAVVVAAVVLEAKRCAEAKVCELDVPRGVNEDVVRFDVAVDKAEGVDRGNGHDKLGEVEAGDLLWEVPALHQQRHEVPTLQPQRKQEGG